MNDENISPDNKPVEPEVWPRKLNKVLIGVGVLAFGSIIADRLVDMFRADDMPQIVEVIQEVEVEEQSQVEGQSAVSEVQEDSAGDLKMEDVFGGRLVFVSASEPLYVVTDDDRRIDIGDPIDEQTRLSAITDQGVVVDKAGNLLVVRLPDPAR
ncbi:MAG: hypothetical protein AB8B64_23270 [Granulosicoccus sp.]